jgi:hypothetical protein
MNGNCLLFNGNYLDGTPCGETGYCEKGVCTGQDTCIYIFFNIKSENLLAGIKEISQ